MSEQAQFNFNGDDKMALEKETKYLGVTANYWKIVETATNCLTNKTRGTVALYLNKEARTESEKNILGREVFEVEGTDLTRTQLYAKIKESKKNGEGKELNFFADAKDV